MTITKNNNQLIAAIDIGTNSIHLVIAYMDSKGALITVRSEKQSVRLGESMGDMKLLSDDAISRGINALKRFSELAESHNALIRATATSAVREAENKQEFIHRAKNEAGVEVEIISGHEEARLIYLGVIRSLPLFDKKVLVIDIGGGSTETIIGQKGYPIYLHSEKLGAIRLAKRFFENGVSSPDSVSEARRYIHGVWNSTVEHIREEGFSSLIGTSGTIQSIASIAIASAGIKPPDELNGIAIHSENFLAAIESIISAKTVEERNKIPGMDSSRVDILPAGSLIIEYLINQLNIRKIIISSYALREGLVFDTLEKIQRYGTAAGKIRQNSVMELSAKYNVNIPHAEKVRDFCETLFSFFYHILELDSKDSELLYAAAILHDIGYFISDSAHHKHSYYLIANSDLPGFSDDEREIIANVARYHRKSLPKANHENFSDLSAEKQKTIYSLASLLRIAEGLDRRMKQFIEKITIVDDGARIRIIPERKTPEKIDIEIWGAARRCDLLAELIGKPIIIIEEVV